MPHARQGGHLKKIISLSLALLIILLNMMLAVACAPDPDPDPEIPADTPTDDPGEDDGGNQPTDGPTGSGPSYNNAGIIIPEYKDYGRGTRDFSVLALDYARPDIDKICAEFDTVSALITENSAPFADQLAAVIALEDGYNSFRTAYTVAEIYNSKDTTNLHWAEEYSYISEASPKLTGAVEDLYVAAARSPFIHDFEDQYFGFDISEYADGGKYTDAALEYMSDEAELENRYTSLSEATVEITYTVSATEVITGSYADVLEELSERYGEGSARYEVAASMCQSLYSSARNSTAVSIYVDLLKVRYLIAEELGYDSYTEYAYEMMEYDYTPDDTMALIGEIGESVYSMYRLLYSETLSSVARPKWSTSTLMNNAYAIAGKIDSSFGEVFAYMLQHGLYDVSPWVATRLDASFTTYIEENNSPYLFTTTSGYLDDYSTVMHEFGHFVDGYVNYGMSDSLEVAELCSQGLELLSLLYLREYTTASAYDQMIYLTLMSTLEVFLYQGLFSAFEHLAYALPYNEITPAALETLTAQAETMILGNSGFFNTASLLVIHLYVAPMYVQSYFTSAIPALEIYLDEAESAGSGIAAYKKVIWREDDGFTEVLEYASLTSPFADGALSSVISRLAQHLAPVITKYS